MTEEKKSPKPSPSQPKSLIDEKGLPPIVRTPPTPPVKPPKKE